MAKGGGKLPIDRVPHVTNVRHEVRKSAAGAGFSAATVQATGPVSYALLPGDDRRPTIRLSGVRTRIPDGSIAVHDGLLDRIVLAGRGDRLDLTLELAHPTVLRIRAVPGMPASLDLELDRGPLRRIMRGRRVLVDPGHGGGDAGGRGPVDLLEKRMTLAVARYLAAELDELGAESILTRTDDTDLSLRERFDAARLRETDAMVSLHTAWFSDPSLAGARVLWVNPHGRRLARWIHAAIRQKLPLPDRGLAESVQVGGLGQPAVIVEFATISNPVEEGWLRSSTFLKRAATAVANGLKDYFGAWVSSCEGIPRGEGGEGPAAGFPDRKPANGGE